MTTLHQQLTAAYTAHLAGNPDAAYARKAFDAGVRAGLEVAADHIERLVIGTLSSSAQRLIVERLRTLAREIA